MIVLLESRYSWIIATLWAPYSILFLTGKPQIHHFCILVMGKHDLNQQPKNIVVLIETK